MGFLQLINSSTRNENVLDLLFTNDEQLISDCDIIPPFSSSDHDSIQFNIVSNHTDLPAASENEMGKFVWAKADWTSLFTYCTSIDWNFAFVNCTTADECWTVFTNILNAGINCTVPIVKCSNAKRKCHGKAVDRLISCKKALWKKRRENPTPYNIDLYKQICSDINNALEYERSIREFNVICSGNLGSFYRHVHNRISHRSSIAPIRDSSGVLLVSDTDKAESLCEYFSEVGVTDDGISPTCHDYNDQLLGSDDISALNIVYYDFYSVFKDLCVIKTGAAGPDNLPPILFKNLKQALAQPLSMLFNLIHQFGEVPTLWKTAIVVPIFKKGSPSLASNYRPISLTSSCCKLFETSIKSSLLHFASVKGLISSSQHGFLAKRSTCTNLLEALNVWTEALDSFKDTLVIFIDFAKAFDSVSIPKLICKLVSIGVGGNLLSCIKSMLTGRSQKVRVGNALSLSRPVRSGVPQGSVIGPILFILFINDIMFSLPPSARSKLFADDLKSFIALSGDHCITNFSLLLDAITKWSLNWQLPLSVNKCGWMLISNRIRNRDLSFNLAGHALSELNEVKDLGVMYTSQLSFSPHISCIVSKAKQRCFLLRKSFTNSNCRALILAYKTYVIPILDYCSPAWSPSLIADILKIESVQRSFTRSLRSCLDLSYKQRLAMCGLMTLERRRLLADLILLYRIINKLTDIDLGSSLTISSNLSTRGHSFKIVYTGARINSRLHFFTIRTTKIWNSLPETVVCAKSVDSFRNSIRLIDFSKFLIL